MFIFRGNGYGTLPPPGWQWKNCPSPVAPLEPKVFESMDQKRSLERSEGAHPQQSEETCFPPAIASKGAAQGRREVTAARESNASQTARALAGSTSCSRPLSQKRTCSRLEADMYWPAQTPSAHRGPWSTRHNRNPPATVPLFSEETCGIPHKKNLLSEFPVPPTFAFERKGSRDSIRPTDRSSSKKRRSMVLPISA